MIKYNQKFIDFDTETTGLNLFFSTPWELSYVEGKGDKILKEEQIYIDIPNLQLSPLIRKLTNFNDQKYHDTKVSPQVALDKFQSFVEDPDYIFVGQNIIKYDIFILNNLYRELGFEFDFSIMDRMMDTRFLAIAAINNLEKPRGGNYLNWFYKLHNDSSLVRKGVTQEALLKRFGIDYDPKRLHDGLYDVNMNWKVFVYLKNLLKL